MPCESMGLRAAARKIEQRARQDGKVNLTAALSCPIMDSSAIPGRHEMAKARRTTHRSSTGKKLYAVRDSKGRFKDIQTYKRAHSADIKRKSKKEK